MFSSIQLQRDAAFSKLRILNQSSSQLTSSRYQLLDKSIVEPKWSPRNFIRSQSVPSLSILKKLHSRRLPQRAFGSRKVRSPASMYRLLIPRDRSFFCAEHAIAKSICCSRLADQRRGPLDSPRSSYLRRCSARCNLRLCTLRGRIF